MCPLFISTGNKFNINVAHALGTPGWKFILQIPKMLLKDWYNIAVGNDDADKDTGTALDSFGIQDLRFEWNIKRTDTNEGKGKAKMKTEFTEIK